MKLVLISMVCLLGARAAPLANHHEAEAPPTVVPLEKVASANSEETANVPSDTVASSITPAEPSLAPAVVENAEAKSELSAEAQIPNLKSETNLENSPQPQSSSSSQEKKEDESKPVAREASLEQANEKKELPEQNAEAQVVPQTQPQQQQSGEAKKEDESLKEAASEVKETVQATSQEAQPQAPAEVAEKKVSRSI